VSAAQFSLAADRGSSRDELRAAFAAARTRLLLVAALLVLAGLAWWWTAEHMRGMDAGPGTDLGGFGWFVGVWVVMMAAMMFPAIAPTIALYSRMTRARRLLRPLLFAGSYLVVWGFAGVCAYGVYRLGRTLLGYDLAWSRGGRWAAAGVLTAAALYELTPLKDVCLQKCRTPMGFLVGSWREGARGAVELGARNAAWCLGCCWALMAALFALGVMSLAWMAFVAALITLEKTLPWRRAVLGGTTALLLALVVLVVATPDSVPALTLPGSARAHHAMRSMGMSTGGEQQEGAGIGSGKPKSMGTGSSKEGTEMGGEQQTGMH
jgi:predicted metal-binding membrane protein